jgi:uncharacterized protein YukE
MSVGAPTLGQYAIPGDPSAIRSLAARIGNTSEAATQMRGSIAQQSLRGEWTGDGVTEYTGASSNCTNNLVNLESALSDAGNALSKFVGALEARQDTAAYLASRIREYQADLQNAKTRVTMAEQTVRQLRVARDAATLPHDRAVRERALSSGVVTLQDAEAAVDDLEAQLSSLMRSAASNYEQYEGDRASLCGALSGARTYSVSQSTRWPQEGPPSPIGPSLDPSVLSPLFTGDFDEL